MSDSTRHFKAMGIIQKQRNWVPYELKPRDIERGFFDFDFPVLH